MDDREIVIESMPVRCRVYGLSIRQSDGNDEGLHSEVHQATDNYPWKTKAIVMSDRPFQVQLTVEWLDTAAIALLMLTPILSVDAYLKPMDRGETVALGTVEQPTSPGQRIYTPTLVVESPDHQGIEPGLYSLYATVRVGAKEGPALLWDVIDGVRIEVFAQASDEATTNHGGTQAVGTDGAEPNRADTNGAQGGRSLDADHSRSERLSKKATRKR